MGRDPGDRQHCVFVEIDFRFWKREKNGQFSCPYCRLLFLDSWFLGLVRYSVLTSGFLTPPTMTSVTSGVFGAALRVQGDTSVSTHRPEIREFTAEPREAIPPRSLSKERSGLGLPFGKFARRNLG